MGYKYLFPFKSKKSLITTAEKDCIKQTILKRMESGYILDLYSVAREHKRLYATIQKFYEQVLSEYADTEVVKTYLKHVDEHDRRNILVDQARRRKKRVGKRSLVKELLATQQAAQTSSSPQSLVPSVGVSPSFRDAVKPLLHTLRQRSRDRAQSKAP